MQELLDLLEQKPDIPRNTYVLAAKDAGKIIELGQETGTYLEQLIENSSLMEKEAYPTIGTLYAEQENRVETLFCRMWSFGTVSRSLPAIMPGCAGKQQEELMQQRRCFRHLRLEMWKAIHYSLGRVILSGL